MWDVEPAGDKWQVTWRGQPFGSPRADKQAAYEAIGRYAIRYPGETPGILLGVAKRKLQRRSGLWCWSTKDGDSGAFFATSMKEAREILRSLLHRKRLPSDLTLELAE